MFSFSFLKNMFYRRSKPFKPKWSVVIDPGHGGSKPGAVNKRYGYKEKDINLAVSEYMRKYIEGHVPNLVSHLTRFDDRTVSLPDRCKWANDARWGGKMPDAFISIHTNARVLKGRYGLEIETFYFRGSEEGYNLAHYILVELIKCQDYNMPVINRGVKIGQRRGDDGELKDFYVLRETAMPAVLVELGFLSDDEEAKLLVNPANQELMAMAVVDGVVKYLEQRE